jgi:hypothetical protein
MADSCLTPSTKTLPLQGGANLEMQGTPCEVWQLPTQSGHMSSAREVGTRPQLCQR